MASSWDNSLIATAALITGGFTYYDVLGTYIPTPFDFPIHAAVGAYLASMINANMKTNTIWQKRWALSSTLGALGGTLAASFTGMSPRTMASIGAAVGFYATSQMTDSDARHLIKD